MPGQKRVNGKTYKVVNVSYNDGTGYSSDDEFVVYIDSDTHKLAFVNNSVSEIEAVERVTWVYDEWQEVDGLLVPAKISFYPGWKPGQPGVVAKRRRPCRRSLRRSFRLDGGH